MSCIYKYKGQEFNEAELKAYLASDQALVNSYRPQEERIGDDYDYEDRDTFNRKVAALKKSMNVEVKFDENIESSRVLGKNHPDTKKAGKPVIVINPNKIFKTTAIHEFAHIFIDAFPGGLENKRLQKALKQLEGTAIEAQVKKNYPELSEDMQKKEMLATAIGIEGSQIWEDGENASAWESFKAWFFDFLNRTFGLNKDEVKSLSRDLLDSKVKDINIEMIEEIDQQQKVSREKEGEENKTEADKNLEEELTSLEKTYRDVKASVTKAFETQKKLTASAMEREKKNREEGKKTRLSSVTDLKKVLEEYEDIDMKLGLIKYVKWARDEMNFMDKTLDERSAENKINPTNIDKSIDWNTSFNIVSEIQTLLEVMSKNKEITDKQRNIVRNSVRQIQAKRSQIEAKLLTYSRDVYIAALSNNDTQTEKVFRDMYGKEWDDLESIGDTGMQRDEFIMQKMQENKDEVDAAKERKAEARAENAVGSLSLLSMGLLSEKDLKSRDIALVSAMLDSASNKIEMFATQQATAMNELHKEFKKAWNSRDNRKKYEGMFTFSESGQGYFTTKYSPEFLEEKRRKSILANDQQAAYGRFKDTRFKITKVKDTNHTRLMYNSEIKSIDGKTVSRMLKFGGVTEMRVVGAENLKEGERPTHVIYKINGIESPPITLEEAIAKSEYYWWKKKNTRSVGYKKDEFSKDVEFKEEPIAKWLSEDYADLEKNDPEKLKHLNKLLDIVKKNNERYDNKSSLISPYKDVEFVRLPGMMKSTTSRVVQRQSAKTFVKHKLSELIQTQADEFENETVAQFTGFAEGEKLRVPVTYRARLKESDQSLDLHTMVLMDSIMSKNYEEKQAIESTLKVISEVVKNKKFPLIDKRTGKQAIDAQTGKKKYITGNKDSAEYKKIVSMIENRLYGITTKQSQNIKVGNTVVETQQVARTAMKYFGSVSLVLNYANSIVNTTTGTLSNFMEAIGGDTYSINDYKKASAIYWKDIKNIMNDFGANVATSRTNMLLNQFNTMGPEYLQSNFEEKTRAEGLAKGSSLRPLAKMGEHAMQSKVMYSILESIKVQDEKGRFIDKDGKVVSSKKKAASLNDMISFKRGADGSQIMELHFAVFNTSFTSTGEKKDILLETRNLIRSKVDELHGQYTSDIQSHAQRYALGKLGFFLRKWMIPGYLRRFRGIKNFYKASDAELAEADQFYSHDQKDNIEGYYISTSRFISKIIKDMKEDKFNIIKSWSELTPKQKAGIRKSIADVSFMIMIMLAYSVLEAEDDDDDLFVRYLLRRQQSELMFFADPRESLKIAQTPTAAVGNLKQLIRTFDQMLPWNFGEVYEQGPYKGDSKLYHSAKKLLPRIKTMEDFKQAEKFLNSSASGR